jgi:hypothetical protein
MLVEVEEEERGGRKEEGGWEAAGRCRFYRHGHGQGGRKLEMESEGDGRPSEAIPNVGLVVVVVVAPPSSSRLLFHTFMAAKPLAGDSVS